MSVLRRRMMQTPPDLGYVPDGLVLHLDGIYNTWGGHDPSATEWYDLSGSGNSAEVVNGVWSANSLTPNGSCVSPLKPLPDYSYELVVRYVSGQSMAFLNGLMAADSPKIWPIFGTSSSPHPIFIGFSDVLSDGNTGFLVNAEANTEWDTPRAFSAAFAKVETENKRLLSVYTDGALFKSGVVSIAGDSNVNAQIGLSVGRDVRWSGYQGPNEVYAVRIYDRPLTAEEIAHNYAIDKRRFEM